MKIRSIRKIEPRTVYAIKTSSGTYVADGLAHHNCTACNIYKHGNPIAYRYAIDRKYGEGTADLLYAQKDREKESMADLREKLIYYKQKVKELETFY